MTNTHLAAFSGAEATLECVYTGRRSGLAATSIVTVTSRQANDELAAALAAQVPSCHGFTLMPPLAATILKPGKSRIS